MMELTFTQLQKYISLKYNGKSTSSGLFMKLVEEIGEVAEVLNQLEGWKNIDPDASLEKELIDVLHYAIAIASVNDIDLTKVILEKDREASIKYNHSMNLEQFLSSKKKK